jgi:ribosomal protein S18 acetylase RimI-like enzyme
MIKIRKVLNSSEKVLEEINQLLPQLSKSAKPLNLDDLEGLIECSSTHLYFAEEDEMVLGMLSLVIFQIPTGVRAWVEDVVVHGKARGKGVGKMLTLTALSEAKQFGALTVDLTSRPSREVANKLYMSVGFEPRMTNVYRYKHG